MKKTTIVIIGKPNVGKSTLFNRLIGKTKSIVSPIEGITRDRVFGTFEWLNNFYELIDSTDSQGFKPDDLTDAEGGSSYSEALYLLKNQD